MIENKEKLEGVNPELVQLVKETSKVINVRILEGVRSVKRQAELMRKSKSRISNASTAPHVLGNAVDMVPLTKRGLFAGWGQIKTLESIDEVTKELGLFYSMQAVFRTFAYLLDRKVRVGADWNMDWNFKDQSFDDLVHFEISKEVIGGRHSKK